MPALNGDPDIQNSFIVQSSAPPGSLAANLIATGEKTSMSVQLIGKDEKTANGGAHPWTIENGTSSTLLLFNHTNQTGSFNVYISGGGVFWQQNYSLTAWETKALNINQLIATQAKGLGGLRIPKGTKKGLVGWSVISDGGDSTGTGRILVSNPDALLAQNFSCGTQTVLCGLELQTNYLDLIIDGQDTMGPTLERFCIVPFPQGQACSGSYSHSQSVAASWSSNNPSIASVSSTGLVTGVSHGSTSITAKSGSLSCMQGIGTANVQVPTSTRVVSSNPNAANSCPSGQAGWNRVTTRAVTDQTGVDIKQAGQQLNESLTVNNNALNISFSTHNGSTDYSGQFSDTFAFCSGVCISSPGATTSVTQHIVDTFNGTYPLTDTALVYACGYVTVNGGKLP